MDAPPRIVFDMDDTLIRTSATFDAARDRFATLMAARGFPREEALAVLTDLDLRRVEAQGFGRTRFPLSLRDTYVELCARKNLPVDDAIVREVQQIGADVFNTPPEAFEDTHDVLRRLRGEGCHLYLLTKGDQDVQQFRIEGASLRGYFDAIHIFPTKGLPELRAVLAEHDLPHDDTWVVGDGIRSDINPALEEGLLAILVGEKRWAYEDVPPISNKFYRVPGIRYVPDYVLSNGNRPPLPGESQDVQQPPAAGT
jgi:putative hydrolase of the HAD superfamily